MDSIFFSLFSKKLASGRILYLLLLCLYLSPTTLANAEPTLIQGGSITGDVVWEKHGSPYVVIEDLVIEEGSSLTIDPGVEVRLVSPAKGQEGKETAFSTPDTDIIVRGTLIAEGVADKYVRFIHSGSGNQWGAIFFTGKATANCVLRRCFISGGRIVCNYSSPTIEDCDITSGGGIEVDYLAGPHIFGNRIFKNTKGISCNYYSSRLDVSYNIITENQYGLYIKDFDQAVIYNNLIYGNTSYNVWLEATKNLAAPGNWWGSTLQDSIRKHIYDYNLDNQLGKVLVEPIAETQIEALATPTLTQTLAPTEIIPTPTSTTTIVILKKNRSSKQNRNAAVPTFTPVLIRQTPEPKLNNGPFKSGW